MAVWYVDPDSGSDSNTGASFAQAFATPAGASIAKGVAAGDTVRIKASPAKTTLGTCTWTNGSATVTIPANLTLNISTCETAWTASANVTCSTTTTSREGTNAAAHTIASAFTTGLAAYKALGAATDFSSMKQVSFQIKSNVVTAAGDLTLRLCSDAAGVTAVNTISVPAIAIVNQWHSFTVDTGAALGNSIQSVALYVATDLGAQVVTLDNILACKDSTSADAITLNCAISKDSASGPEWYAIRSINGTTVILENGNAVLTSNVRPYPGTTESVTTYMRTGFNLVSQTTSTVVNSLLVPGTATAPVLYSGGWNRTDMSTQTDETWYSQGSQCSHLLRSDQAFHNFEKISIIRGVTTIYLNYTTTLSTNTVTQCHAAGSQYGVYGVSVGKHIFSNCYITGPSTSIGLGHGTELRTCSFDTSSASSALTLSGTASFYNTKFRNNNSYAILDGSIVKAFDCTFTGQGTGTYNVTGGSSGIAQAFYMVRCINSDPLVFPAPGAVSSFAGATVYAQNFNNTANDHRVFSDGVLGTSDLVTVHTAGIPSYKLNITSTNRTSSYPATWAPITMPILCLANQLVTVNCWMRRDSTSCTPSIVLPMGQIAGYTTSDTVASCTAAINTWQQVTLTFTPTETGAVQLEFRVSCTAQPVNAWITEITIT